MFVSRKTRASRRRSLPALGSVALAAALLVACGGGGDSATDNVAVIGQPPPDSAPLTVEQALAKERAVMDELEAEAEDRQDPATQAFGKACKDRNNNTFQKLLKCMTLDRVRAHQLKLRDIALANNGTRAAGTPGYDQSADYAEKVFRDAGYTVTRQPFEFTSFTETAPTVLRRLAPAPEEELPTIVFSFSGSGEVSAAVSTLATITGCEAADFAGFPAGNIALISRGACSFATKATNAAAAGASAAVIYNNVPGDLNGTLGEAFETNIVVTAVTQEVGAQLVSAEGLRLSVSASTLKETLTTTNVIAESKGGNPNNVVMMGAHLDSVTEGPGINDNGSGSAAILELAVQMGKVQPTNKLRFALWGAEELGLVGATHYVATLSDQDLNKIALYLNYDMIGSPNHVFFVYDGDNSDGVGAGAGPVGSFAIEKTYETFYNQRSISFKGTDFDGRSDYGPFIEADIPAGGLFTGAEGIKTEAEAEVWGGVAGTAYDPCYHLACDGYGNVNLFALDTNIDAMAYAGLKFAMTTISVNGVPGAKPKARSQAAGLSKKGAPERKYPAWSGYPKRYAE